MKTHRSHMNPHRSLIEPLETRIAPAAVAVLNLSSLDGKTGFKISGEVAGDYSGVSVSAAGDVNGDGFADLLIGATGADPNGTSSGASYVVFGKAGRLTPSLELSTLHGANGLQIKRGTGRELPRLNLSPAG